MPFVNYGGPSAVRPDVETALLERAEELCRSLRVKYLEIRTRHHLGERWPSLQHKVSLTVELDANPDVLWNAFKSGHRQQIRKAYKVGVTTRHGSADLIGPFHEVMSESWRSLGTPLYNRRYFEEVARGLGTDCRVTVLYVGDEPAAAAFDGLHRDTVEGMWLGLKPKFRDQYIGYALYWELIKQACETGFKHFHLGRSTADSGGDSFKRKWNANSTQLYWHYALVGGTEMPSLNVDNPKFQLAMSAWRRLPMGVTQVVGPMIARNIP
jgi:FemAB-related protein (PEP-CTERM system-associated)